MEVGEGKITCNCEEEKCTCAHTLAVAMKINLLDSYKASLKDEHVTKTRNGIYQKEVPSISGKKPGQFGRSSTAWKQNQEIVMAKQKRSLTRITAFPSFIQIPTVEEVKNLDYPLR